MRLFLVRHGETQHNVDRRIQGPLLDAELNARGLAQAAALEERFAAEHEKGLRLAAVYSSPMKRAWTTAEAVARAAAVPVPAPVPLPAPVPAPVPLPALIEYSWGIYLGRTETEDVLAAMEAMHRQWRAGFVDAAPPEGESPASAWARAWGDLGPVLTRHAKHKDSIALVAHGRIFKILLARLVTGDLSRMEDFPQGNTGVTLLEHDGKGPFDSGWSVRYVNDQSHLRGLEPDTSAVGRKPLV